MLAGCGNQQFGNSVEDEDSQEGIIEIKEENMEDDDDEYDDSIVDPIQCVEPMVEEDPDY